MAEGTALVGRHDELAQLERWLDVADAGEAGIVLLEGEAGVGKSRLLGELRRRAAQRGVLTLSASGHEGVAVPFLPITSALAPLVDLTASPTGADDGPDAASVSRFATAADALLRAGEDRTVLLCLDDLHWFDEPSTELLAHLLSALVHSASIGATRVLVVVACRPSPEEAHVRRVVASVRREPIAQVLRLQGLDVFGLSSYVELLLDAPPEKAFLYALEEASHGNPLMARAILDRLEAFGGLRVRDGHVMTTGTAELTGLPRELNEMLQLRLDAISNGCAQLLTTASFLGDEGLLDDLLIASALDEDRFDVLLDEAISARLLDTDRDRYRFDHPLLSQLLYHRPVGRRRQGLHLTIADRLEVAYGGEDPARALVLAHHLRAAGPTVDAHRLTNLALVAGNEAAASGAWAEAVRCFTNVLELADDDYRDGAFGAVLRRRLANACFHCHQFVAGKAHAARAVDQGRALGDLRLWGESLLVSVNLEAATTEGIGPLTDATPLLEFVAVAEASEPALAARVHAAIAQVQSTADDQALAREHVVRSRELAATSGDAPTIAAVEQGAGIHHLFALELDDATDAFVTSRAAAEQTNDQSARTWPVSRAGIVRFMQGDLTGARDLLVEASARARPGWMWQELSYATSVLGAIAAVAGDEQLARHDSDAALRLYRWNTVWLTPVIAFPTLIALDLEAGNIEGAERWLGEWRAVGGRGLRRHELLITAARDGAEAARSLLEDRPVRVPTAATIMTADVIVVHAAVAVAAESASVATDVLPVLEELREARGVHFVPGWPALTTRLLAACRSLVGDAAGARAAFDLAEADADAAGSAREVHLVAEARRRGAC